MEKQMKDNAQRRRLEVTLIMLFCAVVTGIVISVLIFVYRPNQNALGALGTVCMDVLSILVLLLMVVSLTVRKEEANRTTRLFLGLLLASVYALFFDFLTWSADGSLAFSDWTYVYTVCSLVCGCVLAALFILYLSSYMDDMHGIKQLQPIARACFVLNMISFVITLALALSKQAFTYVNGHYETGVLYDAIMIIPVLSLIVFCGCIIRWIKVIGSHDVLAVVCYIATMIVGAVVEEVYNIGATYVSVAIANVLVFIMLQNKLLDRAKSQRKTLEEKNSWQFSIMESMAGIYSHVNYVDLIAMTARRFDQKDSGDEPFDLKEDPHTTLNRRLFLEIENDLKAKFWDFTNLSTLSDRMKGEKVITGEFCHRKDGWFRAQYIRIGDCVEEPITKVIYTIRNIDEEKRNVEKWIRKSNTDELTGFYNRHAYEDDIAALEEGKINPNLVYVSIDVNGLKQVNDSRGHSAGDELLTGACACMKQCFGSYGKLYRTGGDEFVALIFADDSQLSEIQKDIDEVVENWTGSLIDHMAISIGYVTKKEARAMSIHEMAVLADKRMYEEKNRYYQQKGIDRRGQRDAHVALCSLYTKILKVNLTEDTYQIINMDDEEKSQEKGFSDRISSWLQNFGTSGQVHPEDLSGYLKKTELDFLRNYFKENKTSLCIFYRRKIGGTFVKVMMEMIPANDYSDSVQNIYLYVKNIQE